MSNPKITVLLCTVRPDAAYLDNPEWHVLGRILEDLEAQTFRDFEVVIVDGRRQRVRDYVSDASFRIVHVLPRKSIWVQQKRVAISAYRNTGLIYARGELVVNLDDCCRLPPDYLETFWHAWSKYRVCLSPLWHGQGDTRSSGRVQDTVQQGERRPSPLIYGFGSYPLDTAVNVLNGYDEAYDGSQALEDADWSIRLHQAGVQMALVGIPGFSLERQCGYDKDAHNQPVQDSPINLTHPLVKCCNPAWQLQRVQRHVLRANEAHLWDRKSLEKLVGPCWMLNADETCQHHQPAHVRCAYINERFPHTLTDEAALIFDHPPVVDLVEERRKVHG